jgi:tRNA dimethylallyltransferase
MMHKYLIVITGPTGIGKSKTGILLAKHFHSEIISADSRQVFKEMTIGTAVPTKEELSEVRHHFIHSHSVTENYNASRYETEAIELIEKLFVSNNILFLVGGSMLYIDAICKGIDEIPDIPAEIRESVKNQYKTEGLESIRLQLKKLDPEYYLSVDLKNHARIIHALEVCQLTGKTYSSFRLNRNKQRSFEIIKIGLNCDRELLHNKINHRVDQMIAQGLEKEARNLFHLRDLSSMNTVGYRELFDYFDGTITKDQAVALIKRNSRRYARKQITWFRSDPDVKWFEPQEYDEIKSYIEAQIISD